MRRALKAAVTGRPWMILWLCFFAAVVAYLIWWQIGGGGSCPDVGGIGPPDC